MNENNERVMTKLRTNVYNPKKARALTEDGRFINWEDGVRLAEQQEKLNPKPKGIKDMSDEELEAEMKRRAEAKKGAPAPKILKDNSSTDEDSSAGEDESVIKSVDDLDELTAPELRAMLEEKGIPYPKRGKKDKLIALLRNDGMPEVAQKL